MAPGKGGGVERGGKPQDGHRWCGHRYIGLWYLTYIVMVELKLLEFIELTGCQPCGHRAGYVQQVACRDADALDGALVGGDDGFGEFRIIID